MFPHWCMGIYGSETYVKFVSSGIILDPILCNTLKFDIFSPNTSCTRLNTHIHIYCQLYTVSIAKYTEKILTQVHPITSHTLLFFHIQHNI